MRLVMIRGESMFGLVDWTRLFRMTPRTGMKRCFQGARIETSAGAVPRRMRRISLNLGVGAGLPLLLCFGDPNSSRVRAAEESIGVCEREMARAAGATGVPLGVLYSVALTESGRGGLLQPYALNIDGVAYFGKSLKETIRAFELAKERGAKLIDVGCMQINHRFHGKHFSSLPDMMIPSRNVDYAARFLRELKSREGTWTKAVARYHAGAANIPAQKRYVCSVIGNLVQTGLGAWTNEARTLCSSAVAQASRK